MRKTLLLLFIIIPSLLFANSTVDTTEKKASYKFTDKGLVRTLRQNENILEERVLLKPIVILRSKYELATESGYSRFNMRTSRLGVEGALTKFLSYKFLMDLSDDGKFKVLDLYADFKISKRLSFSLGQQSLSLYNSWTTSPNKLDYVNRQFISKYFASSRDIGLSATYAIKQKGFPISIEAGVYNGDGINNPEWTRSLALGGRVIFGSMKGVRTTAKIYRTKEDDENDLLYWGADFRYENKKFRFETEFMAQENNADVADEETLHSIYAQTLWKIPVNNVAISMIQPCFRWDAMGYDMLDRGFGVNRATIGANMVFNTPVGGAVLKLNYEHYFNTKQDLSAIFKTPIQCESKLSLEVLLYF